MTQEMIPLVKAAALLKVNYHLALNMVLRGELTGWQTDRGRWLVAQDSLLLARRPPEPTSALDQGSSYQDQSSG